MLPNVSAIYRDLTFLSNPSLDRNNAGNSYTQQTQNSYQDKQLRHNQLMEKFRNAQRESSSLTGQASGYQNYQSPSLQSNHSYNMQSSFSNSNNNSQSVRGWKPPSLRYRHIEDFQKPQIPQFIPNNEPQIRNKKALQKEFYEQKEKPQQKQLKKKDTLIEKVKQQNMNVPMQQGSQSSYGRTWINRQSKFEDKLESYYELCRKRPVSYKQDQSQNLPMNKNKFTRGNNSKPNVMELDKAMKLLSFD